MDTHYQVCVKNEQAGNFCILSDTYLIDCNKIKEKLLLAHKKQHCEVKIFRPSLRKKLKWQADGASVHMCDQKVVTVWPQAKRVEVAGINNWIDGHWYQSWAIKWSHLVRNTLSAAYTHVLQRCMVHLSSTPTQYVTNSSRWWWDPSHIP